MRIAMAALLLVGVSVPRSEVEALPQQSAPAPAAGADAGAAAAGARSIPVRYTLKTAGLVSAAVYDAQGRMVRPLLYGQKQEPGEHGLFWDGLDRYGQALPAGEYEWRMLRTPGFKREFLVNLGTNITWAPVDFWVGNHAGPSLVQVDDNNDVWVGSRSSEGPPMLIRMTMDGSKLLYTSGTWGGVQQMLKLARIGDVWFVLIDDATLEVRTAKPLGGATEFNYVYNIPKLKKFAVDRKPYADLLHEGDDRKQKKLSPMSMAGGKDFLVITYQNYDEVRFLYPKDDVIARTDTVKVSKPASVTVSSDGQVYVASGSGAIVRIDPETAVAKPVVTDPELIAPACGCLTYDPFHKDLIVANGNHLRRYNVASGKLVAVYGRPQGRTYGVFNPMDFDSLLDVAADRKGGFFTVEENPRRVAHFQGREKHEQVQQWFGGLPWEWPAMIDPAKPTAVYMGLDSKHIGRGEIDYARKTWTLTHLYDLPERFGWGANGADMAYQAVTPGEKSDIVPGWTKGDMFPGVGGCGWQVRHVAGQTLLVNTLRGVSVVRVDEKEHRLVPVARLGCLHPTIHRRNPPDWWIAALKKLGIDATSRDGMGTDNPKAFQAGGGYERFCYSWTDTNRNGRIDVDEISLGSGGSRFIEGNLGLDEAWNVYWPGGSGSAWTEIPNVGKDKDLPMWNWNDRRPGKGAFGKREQEITSLHAVCPLGTADGSVYMTAKGVRPEGDIAPLQWPNNASAVSRFIKWNSRGEEEFSVGIHTPRNDGVRGGFADIRSIVGLARGNVVVRDACSPATVWTPDGLCAGEFVYYADERRPKDAARERSIPDKNGQPMCPISDDTQEGQVIETEKGEVLWGANDSQNTVFFRIQGWDGWERQKGKLTLAAPAAAALWKGKGLKAEFFADPDLKGAPVLQRTDVDIGFGPMWGNFRPVPARNEFFRKDGVPAGLNPSSFSARWTGFVEPPVGESFNFVLLAYGPGGPNYNPPGYKATIGARVRLWVDGKLVIDAWDGVKLQKVEGWYKTQSFASGPIPLTGGKRVPIRLEFAAAGDKDAHLHLYWDSPNWELRHIPGALLYSE